MPNLSLQEKEFVYNSVHTGQSKVDRMEDGIGADEITRLLGELRLGNSDAADQLIPLVYGQLRRAAARLLHAERAGQTMQPTALVDDALMRLIGSKSLEWQCRAQFFALASRIMREILIDHARAHRADRRGGRLERVPLDEGLAVEWRNADSVLILDQALDRLQQYDPRLSKTVEMRFFAGMTEDEIAEVLQVSRKTVQRDWQFARDWLYGEMSRH
jgi:RNA polymerase sigma factor (TIGR02999 family)